MKQFPFLLKALPEAGATAIFCVEAEALFELLIPLVMAQIIDMGVASGDRRYILMKGLQMMAFALISLFLGQGHARFASTGMRPAFRSPMMFTTALVVSITINAKLELVFFVAATVFVPLLFLMVSRVRPLYMRM